MNPTHLMGIIGHGNGSLGGGASDHGCAGQLVSLRQASIPEMIYCRHPHDQTSGRGSDGGDARRTGKVTGLGSDRALSLATISGG